MPGRSEKPPHFSAGGTSQSRSRTMAENQPNEREAADPTLLPVDNPDNQDEKIVTQIMFVLSDLSVDMDGVARVAVHVPDGLEYHKYNLMDTVTLFMRGPKHTYSEMEKLMEKK